MALPYKFLRRAENSNPGEQGYGLTLTYNGLPVGPLTPYGQAMRTVIWVAP